MSRFSWAAWPQLVGHLGGSIDLEGSARRFGLLRRVRQIGSASDLLRLALAFGPGEQSLRETAAWAEMQGIASLSAPGLMYQLRDAGDWLEHVALGLINLVRQETREAAGGVQKPVRIIDGSVISAPGTGKNWRLHATYDLQADCFCGVELTGTTTAEALERGAVVAGCVYVADRVYARPGSLRHVVDEGGDYLVRLGARSLRLLDQDGALLDLPALLKASGSGVIDRPVIIDRHSKRVGSIVRKDAEWQPLAARLIAIPKPPEAAALSRKQAARSSQRGMHQVQDSTLQVADWLILITSLPTKTHDVQALMQLYRKRWQVEIAFKRLKSILRINRLPAKEPRLTKAWLYAHLIFALLIDQITPQLRDSPP